MRLNLTLSPSTDPVSFNHLHRLTGTLHKWLGADNDWHDGISLYSFGWLHGAVATNGHLTFPNGSRWNVSFHELDAAKSVLRGILEDPAVFAGMRVEQVQEIQPPSFGSRYRFKTDKSPILARRRREDGSRAHLLWSDPEADEILTHTLRRKLDAAGWEGDKHGVRVHFDREYEGAREKVARIQSNGVEVAHKGSLCPVIVEGAPEAVQFAWLVGLGALTGSGFGALQ
jgi:CRISPR-associated endoribonuclease Cas6